MLAVKRSWEAGHIEPVLIGNSEKMEKLGGKVGFDVSRFGRIIENILCKLNFFLDVTRCSVAVTSRGAVCIPSRSDFSDSIVMELAMGVVVADRLEKEVR